MANSLSSHGPQPPASVTSLNGIEILLDQPLAALLRWRAEAVLLLTKLLADSNRTAQAALAQTTSNLTQTRLQNVADAQRFNHQQLLLLLKPLLEHPSLPQSLSSVSGSAHPRVETLESNFVNVFRDWSWSDKDASDETKSHLLAILRLLPKSKVSKTLILGAGSARLAYDLSCEADFDEIVATEVNPLLFLIAKQILAGQTLEFFEIAELPAAPELAVQRQKLALPTQNRQKTKLTLLFNDFHEDLLPEHGFDLVITPWFIDVVGLPFETTASKINRLLKPGGAWINLGPLMFATTERSELLTQDEVEESLSAPESGFQIEQSEHFALTQLKSNLSATFRTDRVFGWRSLKTQDQTPRNPTQSSSQQRKSDGRPSLEFLHDSTKPIRLSAMLPGVDLEEVSQSHALLSDILAACHEEKSLREIARKIAPDFGLPPEAVEPIVLGVLTNYLRSQT